MCIENMIKLILKFPIGQQVVQLLDVEYGNSTYGLPGNSGYNTSGGKYVNRGKATPVENEWLLCP